MSHLEIRGGVPLSGRLRVQGAKNSVLPILAAALLAPGQSILRNCPRLSDVEATGKILRLLGCGVEREGETNELGLTVLADGQSFRVLITGDMGAEGEENLVKIADLSQVEVLVAGHHGSDTSTSQALLDAIRPELALISVGKDNSYGHPALEVLDRLEAAGAEVYRTDLDGTIEIRK